MPRKKSQNHTVIDDKKHSLFYKHMRMILGELVECRVVQDVNGFRSFIKPEMILGKKKPNNLDPSFYGDGKNYDGDSWDITKDIFKRRKAIEKEKVEDIARIIEPVFKAIGDLDSDYFIRIAKYLDHLKEYKREPVSPIEKEILMYAWKKQQAENPESADNELLFGDGKFTVKVTTRELKEHLKKLRLEATDRKIVSITDKFGIKRDSTPGRPK